MSSGKFLLTAFCGILIAVATSDAGGDDQYSQLLRQFLQGDALARRELEVAPQEAIVALEDYLLERGNRDLSIEETRQLISQLANEEFQVREAATERLTKEGAPHRDLLEAKLRTTTDPEVAFRLKKVLVNLIDSREANRRQMPLILQALYRRHLNAIAADYFARFEEDLHDRQALLFVEHTNPEDLSRWTEKLSRPSRLRYLLALLFVGHEATGNTKIFAGYSGEEIRTAASETFWPVEIHPPILDGAYHWTVRAANIDGRRATHVMKMSIEKRRQTGEMKHIQSWPQWDYLFRFKSAYLGTYHGAVVMTTHTGYLRTDNVLRVPDALQIPVADVAYKEQQAWSLGRNFEWARQLYPADLVDRVEFRPSPHQPRSKIIAP